MIPNVNLLVAAFRPDHGNHVVAATWLNRAPKQTGGGNIEGNLVTDAWIAAVVLHKSESLATFDKDFRQLLPLPAQALILLDSREGHPVERERQRR